METATTTTEIEILKDRLRAVWNAGDFSEIAKAIERGAEEFVTHIGIRPAMKVLDVACGNGNTALPCALIGADVTGIDIAPYLIDQAKERAASGGLRAKFEVGDAEALPYDDSTFDAVITMYGAMFAPRPDVVAGELKRVCRPGGMIAMANWTPEGFIGQMFKITGRHVPPPAAIPSPVLWGDEDTVRERLSEGTTQLRMIRRLIEFVFPFPPESTVEHFRKFYGPTQKAFEALDESGKTALRNDLEDLWTANNTADDGTTRVVSEYLEVKANRV